MKKILVLILSLILLISLSAGSFAASSLPVSGYIADKNGFCVTAGEYYDALLQLLQSDVSPFYTKTKITLSNGTTNSEIKQVLIEPSTKTVQLTAIKKNVDGFSDGEEAFDHIMAMGSIDSELHMLQFSTVATAMIFLSSEEFNSYSAAWGFLNELVSNSSEKWIQRGKLEYQVSSISGDIVGFVIRDLAAYKEYTTLQVGSQGSEVKELQKALIEKGYLAAGGADGDYGNGTSKAVSAFQKDNGLPETGIADEATQRALLYGDFSAPSAGAQASNFSGLTVGKYLDDFTAATKKLNTNVTSDLKVNITSTSDPDQFEVNLPQLSNTKATLQFLNGGSPAGKNDPFDSVNLSLFLSNDYDTTQYLVFATTMTYLSRDDITSSDQARGLLDRILAATTSGKSSYTEGGKEYYLAGNETLMFFAVSEG